MSRVQNKIRMTEEQALERVQESIEYTKNWKHHDAVLRGIPKEARTEKVCNLVFDHPNRFYLDKEFPHVPPQARTEDLVLRYITARPDKYVELPEELRTDIVSIAAMLRPTKDYGYENSKALPEHLKGLDWEYLRHQFKKVLGMIDKLAFMIDEKGEEAIVTSLQEKYAEYEAHNTRMAEFDAGQRSFSPSGALKTVEAGAIVKAQIEQQSLLDSVEGTFRSLLFSDPDGGTKYEFFDEKKRHLVALRVVRQVAVSMGIKQDNVMSLSLRNVGDDNSLFGVLRQINAEAGPERQRKISVTHAKAQRKAQRNGGGR